MSTVIVARLARSFSLDMFDDLALGGFTFQPPSEGLWTLTFAANLTPEQVAAIRDRLTSTDDADQASRAILRNADDATNRWKLLRSYVLGDPMPEPTYPPPPA